MDEGKTIGITGASGALGKELTKIFRQKGCKVIGFTHSKNNYEKKTILQINGLNGNAVKNFY